MGSYVQIASAQGTSGPGLFSPINIVFLGDSLTRSSYLNSSAPPGCYPGQVQSQLAVNTINLGVNGYTTAQILSVEVPQAVSLYQAGILNIACVLGMVNDLGTGVSVATVESNLSTIVSTLQATGYKVVILTMHPSAYTSYSNYPAYIPEVQAVNSWILAGSSGADAVANSGQDPRLFNQSTSPYSTFPSSLYQSDALHLKELGYSILDENVASAIQTISKSSFAYLPTDVTGTQFTLSFPQPANIKVSEWLSVNDFGASKNNTADINTQAINNCIAAAKTQGKSVRFPDVYYNIHKINVITFGSQQSLRLWSDSNYITANGPATLLICDGGGASWLKGSINIAPPNSGNTGPSLTNPIYGMQIEGLYIQQTSGLGVGTLDGFWAVTNFNCAFKNCGVIIPPGSGRWSSGFRFWQCGLNTILDNFSANTCATGISLNGSSADATTAFSAEIQVINPQVQNCNSAGISGAYAEYCKIRGGYALNCAVGFYGNGIGNSWTGGYFSGNTVDVDMLTAAAPWGPTVKPDSQSFTNCEFSSAVNLRNSTGSALVVNRFDTGSSLLIDSNCVATALYQHNSFPATAFTDNGTATFLASSQVGATTPTTLPGITGQFYYYTTTGILYFCSVSGSPGTWIPIGSPSHLNLSYRAVSTSTATILTTDFMVATTVASGACTVNLPQASTCSGLLIGITNYNSGAGLSTLIPHSGDTIQEILSSLPISQYATTLLMSDGTSNWVIISLSITPVAGTGITITQNGTNFTFATNGTQTSNIRTVSTSTTTIALTDFMVETKVVSGGCTATLPQVSTCKGQVFIVSNYNSTTAQNTIATHAGDTIQLGGSILQTQYCCHVLMSDGGTNWILLAFTIVIATGTGISQSILGNTYTLSNSGVTSLAVSGGLSISASTGAITISPPGVWTAYSPTITATGFTASSVSLGICRYVQLGKTVYCRIQITFNATSVGGGPYSLNFTLPVTAFDAQHTFSVYSFWNTAGVETTPFGGLLASTTIGAIGHNALTSGNSYTDWANFSYEAA